MQVTISTYGSGCHRIGETHVKVHGLEAVITPYDYTAPPGTPCTRQLVTMVHQARVAFNDSGMARIIVLGLDHRTVSAINMIGDTLRVERTLNIP